MGGSREASHAGSWYESQPRTLKGEIISWLEQVSDSSPGAVRGVIGPHAGYRYCGHVLAHAYRFLNPDKVCVGSGS